MRCILLPLAVCAGFFLPVPASVTAAGPDPVDGTVDSSGGSAPAPPAEEPDGRVPESTPDAGLMGGHLETQAIPELGQTIIYVRFPDAAQGAATLELLDSAGEVRAVSDVEISGGTGLVVWDGRDAAGEPVPSDLYVARLSFAGRELTAQLVR